MVDEMQEELGGSERNVIRLAIVELYRKFKKE
jgi:hypothetical protein